VNIPIESYVENKWSCSAVASRFAAPVELQIRLSLPQVWGSISSQTICPTIEDKKANMDWGYLTPAFAHPNQLRVPQETYPTPIWTCAGSFQSRLNPPEHLMSRLSWYAV
jgi:hypothetical protein